MGPAYMWLINLSLVDWLSLSDDDKELNTQMRLDWLASYSKASEAVLQHWFWKLLKYKTQNFASLHQVFVRTPAPTLPPPNCAETEPEKSSRATRPVWTRQNMEGRAD